jgi:hypothetical protein
VVADADGAADEEMDEVAVVLDAAEDEDVDEAAGAG